MGAKQPLTAAALLRLAHYWWPKLAVAGTVVGVLWRLSGLAHDFSAAVQDHLQSGAKIVEEQKKTNAKLDVLIGLEGGRRRPKSVGDR